MNSTFNAEDDSESYFTLFVVNNSLNCRRPVFAEEIPLLNFYRAAGLLLGPVNAILNGICIHIFRNAAWKKTAMSRILKDLSVIELCMGISLFLHALIFQQNSTSNTTSPDQNNSDQQSLLTQAEKDEEARNTFIKSIAASLLMVVFSRCLLAFQVTRNWLVVLLAAYRYDKTCRPIGTGTALPPKRIRIILIIVISLSFLVVLPRVFETAFVLCRHDGRFAEEKPLLLKSSVYQIAYLGVVMFIVQSGGPVICVCVLSAFVIRLIAKRRKIHRLNEQKSARHILTQQQNKQSKRGSGQDSQTPETRSSLIENNGPAMKQVFRERPPPSGDKLIFAVCITFSILETPAFFSKILNPYLEVRNPLADLVLSVIANLLIYLDSTMNAFVYMASNPTFRKVASDELLRYKRRVSGRRANTNLENSDQACARNNETMAVIVE
ncbi:unnamed protein product [Calicophoron daubneyi]|uniref:G-protein coupled receptors family 1 profile domain-containing protein n=1 Tax=Calicophoron daubneyi TaxID=300641 RepID=A0AAV2TIA3_CALDB